MAASPQEIASACAQVQRAIRIDGLAGGAKGLLVAHLARAHRRTQILLIAATAARAQELADDIAFFLHPEERWRLALFPECSVLPYSRLSPEPEGVADRLRILYQLTKEEPLILAAPVAAVMRRCPPKAFIALGARTIRVEEIADPARLAASLADDGYEEVGLCEDEGTFARRGGILDIWAPTAAAPVRLEFDEERILSMRRFDPASQRSREEVRELLLIPAREFPFDAAARARAAQAVRSRADEAGLAAHERRALLEALHEGIAVSGIETLLPLFHDATAALFDYLAADALIVVDEPADAEAAAHSHEQEMQALAGETQSPERIVRPEEIMLTAAGLKAALAPFRTMRWNALAIEGNADAAAALAAGTEGNADIPALIASHAKDEDLLTPLVRRMNEWREGGWRVLLACHNEVQAERLRELFRWHGIDLVLFEAPFETLDEMTQDAVRVRLGRLSAGFRWEAMRLAVITDGEIFGSKAPRRAPTSHPMEPFSSFTELAPGDLLVHELHGIGRYQGLAHLSIEGSVGDYLLLEYLGGDKLYLPVYRMNLVGRYIGSGETPPALDRLGGTRWATVQQKVSHAIRLLAKELLEIYAAREVYPGQLIPDAGQAYEEFAAAFPYDETPDQERAIQEIMIDMGTERPMDRLVCGDVGFGKTEVAMRAAFRAAMAGMQVAVLVPTTVLAFQHYETFSRRFAGTPVTVEMLSRFLSTAAQREVAAGLSRGTVDIVIGTHRLLQKDVAFRNLGLLIIDEEHRFGVTHKERIKKLRATVDVIAMTATPIPRTLNLSLSGIRDISIINTPPADRQSITTYVAPFDEGVIRQAILREIARGGQCFFVHNRVETIGAFRAKLAALVPEARIVVGHGRLPEHELERVMLAFLERRADVLLCTTIIESGLDIPAANTILVNRADTFGLAQLYQLRGRVGRSNLKAFAYLLTPPDGLMTPIAKKRLTVLKRFTELGSGFQIAMHDLEFRGAGNLLGSQQSGHIAAVGYELYAKLLDRAVRKLTGKKVEEEIDPELNLRVAAFLPEAYVADPGTRIDLYKRLASREALEEIAALGQELADRFGPLPEEARHLLAVMEIKVLARALRIRQITCDGAALSCQLDATSPLPNEQILALVGREPGRYRIVPPDRLLIRIDAAGGDAAVLAAAKNSLSALATHVSQGVS
jgi:transcription-repair coupling factor (superfamily II helicase)